MKRITMLLGAGILFLCSTFTAFIPGVAEGAVPQLINFQGILRDGSGNPVANGSYSVTFTIYDAASGGTNLWTESQSVTTTNGLFAVLLGFTNPVPDTAFKGSDRWLGIAVSPDPEMAPRQRLVSVGYAYRVNSVDGASGGTITSKVSIGPGHTNTGVQAFVAGGNNTVGGDSATVAGGTRNTASGVLATVAGGVGNTASGFAAKVGGGYFNTASNTAATIGGGGSNTATGPGATVGGGSGNQVEGQDAVVAGGAANTASGSEAAVGGGVSNTASGEKATVGGGALNAASNSFATVGGGQANTAGNFYATVSGGQGNLASGHASTVSGGERNKARGLFSVVGGGGGSFDSDSNSAHGDYSTIGGGHSNRVDATAAEATIGGGIGNFVDAGANTATIGGGGSNVASGPATTIAGGFFNNVSGFETTIAGGSNNRASGAAATVGGGKVNRARGDYSVVGGGGGSAAADSNSAIGEVSTIGGGRRNIAGGNASTVGGGNLNSAGGVASTVPGGFLNTASGDYSFAAGTQARALNPGSFVWGDNTFADFSSTGNNQFLIRAAGGVGIGTNAPDATLHIHKGSAGAVTADGNSTGVFENSTHNFLSLLCPAASDRGVLFGEPGSIADGGVVYDGANNRMDLRTNGNVTRMSITSSGSVGIGTAAPTALLHVNGTAGNNTGVWSNLSDRRLKKEIEPLENALQMLEQLQPVSFRWKDEKKDAEFGRVRGLIAQDVEKVLPEWIKTDPDGYKRIEPIGVDALLIEAIKEQQKQIEELKAEISKIKKESPQAQVEN